MIQRSFRYRLYPTAEQSERMERTADAARFVFNLGLEQRRDFWRQAIRAGSKINFASQCRELTQLRAETPWLAAVNCTPLQQALRDLDRNFSRFYKRLSGYPQFRSAKRCPSFRHAWQGMRISELSDKWAAIYIPKIGLVRMRLTRQQRGRIISATFNRDAIGWHVSLACEIEHETPANALPPVGIDRGVANTIALSIGELISTPNVSQLERRKRRAQRVLSRRQRGSKRYRKQRQRVASLAAKMARIRSHWQHETATGIARRFGTVAIEDLNTSAMMRANRGLARSIAEQGWRSLETKLSYKLEERGGTLVKVHPAYTSRECPACGVIDKRNRESQASFVCRACDFAGHADIVAATNILRRGTAIVEGSGFAPVEAKTHALAA